MRRSSTGDPGIRSLLHDPEGEEVGRVTFSETSEGAFVEVAVRGLAPGFHGFHLHEEPVCDPDASGGPFASAGGHWDEHGEDHGAHTGDLPPLMVNDDGTAYAGFQTNAFDLQGLLEGPGGDGVAVIIHADPDNLGHIPDRYASEDGAAPGPDEETLRTGDSGDRIACGVLEGDDEPRDGHDDET